MEKKLKLLYKNFMAMDFCVLGSDGTPDLTAAIGVEQHYRMFGNISVNNFPLLARMADYYNDAEFTLNELPALADEVAELADTSLREMMQKVIIAAIKTGQSIFTLAD